MTTLESAEINNEIRIIENRFRELLGITQADKKQYILPKL